MKQSLKNKYAKLVDKLSSFSKNKRLKVGCIILKNTRIVSSGYNGTLPGHSEETIIQDSHDINTIHGEQNALMNCCINGIETKDCEMFVSHFPCQVCTKLAIMAGIKKIYFVNDYRNEDNLFKEFIDIEKVNIDEEN